MCEVELAAALEERDRARHDASDSSLAQDEVVAKARDDRDAAVQRRTKVEVELAKTRVELMQANSQLIESIQQKVDLSQQLEQWQVRRLHFLFTCFIFHFIYVFYFTNFLFVCYLFLYVFLQMDMQELLDEQLRNKLSHQELKMRKITNDAPVAPPRRRLLSFFQR